MLSVGKLKTPFARIAARVDLGQLGSLAELMFFPARTGEESTTKNPRLTARRARRKPSTATTATRRSLPFRRFQFLVGMTVSCARAFPRQPPWSGSYGRRRGEKRRVSVDGLRRGMAPFPRRRTLVGRPLMTMNPPLRTEPACMGTVVDAPASAVSNSSTSEWSDMIGCSACLGVCRALQEKGFHDVRLRLS